MVNVKVWSVNKRKAECFSGMSSLMKRPQERPKKRYTVEEVVEKSIKNQKKPPAAQKKLDATAVLPCSSALKEKGRKTTRINWSKGEGSKMIAVATEDWLGKKGKTVDDNDEMIPLKSYNHIVNMPHKTIHKHAASDEIN